MNLDNMDLDLSNYDLQDLLNIFKLRNNFTKEEFKNAKQIVYKMHPDKSHMDKKFFVFFLDAYKLLLKVAEFKFKTHKSSSDFNASFKNIKDDFFNKNEEIIAKKFTNSDDFNKKFNELFVKHYIPPDNDGYGEWLSSNDDIESDYDKKKEMCRSLAINNNIQTFSFSNYDGHNLCNNISNHGASDLKNVYGSESVIPVSEKDFNNIKLYGSIEELKYERSKNINPMSTQEAEKDLDKLEQLDQIESTQRVFKLIKDEECNIKKKNDFWANLKQLN